MSARPGIRSAIVPVGSASGSSSQPEVIATRRVSPGPLSDQVPIGRQHHRPHGEAAGCVCGDRGNGQPLQPAAAEGVLGGAKE